VAAAHGGPVAAASARAAAQRVSDDLVAQFLGAHDEQMERMDALAQEMRGRLTGLQDAVGGLLDGPWRTALVHIDEAGRQPQARERELELASSATRHHGRAFDLVGAPIPITLEQTPANPPKAASGLHDKVHVPPQA
jgi:hypothetical protein